MLVNSNYKKSVFINSDEKPPFIKISEGKPSRFLVDLKKKIEQEQELEEKNKEKGWGKIRNGMESGQKQLYNLIHGNNKKTFTQKIRDAIASSRRAGLRSSMTKVKTLAKNKMSMPLNQRLLLSFQSLAMTTQDAKIRYDKTKNKLRDHSLTPKMTKLWQSLPYYQILNQLAFFNLFNFLILIIFKIFKLFYKLSYGVGWFVVFLFRFIFIVLRKIINVLFLIFLPLKKLCYKLIKLIGLTRDCFVASLLAMTKTISFRVHAKETKKIQYKQLPKLKFYNLKPVFIFASIIFLLISPFAGYSYYRSLNDVRGKVLGESEQAFNNLSLAGQLAGQFNFGQANQNFSQAGQNFIEAQNQLKQINDLVFAIAGVMPNNDLKLASASKNILKIGQLSTELGSNLSLALDSILNIKEATINDGLNSFTIYGRLAINNIYEINILLEPIDVKIIPEEYQEQFIDLKQKIDLLSQGLVQFIDLMQDLKEFLGMSQDKRYLLVFQNNAEMRASGGFIGSFAVIDFRNGQIKNLEVPGGGSYDTEAGLLEKIIAPEPLWLVNPLWHFWDANWWPDWPTTAKKLAWFYEKSDGSTVDGVISLTPTVIENLLSVIGPVDMTKDYGVIIDENNFWQITQTLAEQKPPETTKPKKIIGDLAVKIIEQLPTSLSKENLIKLIKIVEENLKQKQILFYFTNADLQDKITQFDWSGIIKPTSGDYFSVVNTNIAGGKSDKKIIQAIEHQAEIMADGSIIDTLTIKRTHTAIKREPFSGVRNVNWLRIYVPEGSQLLAAQGFMPVDQIYFEKPDASWKNDPDVIAGEGQAKIDQMSGTKIYNELGKTVFANWSQVDPGQTAQIYVKYKLPFSVNEILSQSQAQIYPYSVLAQKQPGSSPSQLKLTLKINRIDKIIWHYPENLLLNSNGWEISDILDQDKFWAVILQK